MTEKMTPRQFCRFALTVMPAASPARVAEIIKPECLPGFIALANTARELADELEPADYNLAAHIRLHEIAEWAEDQSGKAVAA